MRGMKRANNLENKEAPNRVRKASYTNKAVMGSLWLPISSSGLGSVSWTWKSPDELSRGAAGGSVPVLPWGPVVSSKSSLWADWLGSLDEVHCWCSCPWITGWSCCCKWLRLWMRNYAAVSHLGWNSLILWHCLFQNAGCTRPRGGMLGYPSLWGDWKCFPRQPGGGDVHWSDQDMGTLTVRTGWRTTSSSGFEELAARPGVLARSSEIP